ncbi:MAG: hypothetical protein ACYCU7_10645 [Acidimicrobiales bacterium]
MTKLTGDKDAGEAVPRCRYCRRPIPRTSTVGRPRSYCKRSHRQRAYEARRRAGSLQIPDGQVLVSQAQLDRLHDRLYTLESALDDVDGDLAGRPRENDYRSALRHLAAAAADLRGFVVEPVTG